MKKKRFIWKVGSATIVVGEPPDCYLKEVEMNRLGQFGYHNFYDRLFIVTHINSGLAVSTFESERRARALCKKLFINVKDKWKTTPIDIVTMENAKLQQIKFSNIVRKIMEKKPEFKGMPVGKGMFQYPGTENDIPF
jgi:hypothetical protein